MQKDGVTWKKDVKNPEPRLRNRSLQNLVYLTGLRWDGRSWQGGKLYFPNYGATFDSRAVLSGGVLNIRDYVGIPLLGSSIDFMRVP